ncbi:hypothetical protein QTP70_017788 [Hemibagrus guttatus]|uniref:Alkylated DNA repair protein AlkB homologue 8 N-terminal domain-containing protein n=1 Tax=Hemibagrus guttatus TaxID=175788 RepID=A0AAE0PQM5_9TELE|nr:hypothetical protein QTP70_017788 [Hemibagrus guttatus]
MFRHSSDDINMFIEAVVGFIGKLADDTLQKTIIRTFPNQKPWVDKTICGTLRCRTAAYNMGLASGDTDSYKAASYNVRKAVKEAAANDANANANANAIANANGCIQEENANTENTFIISKHDVRRAFRRVNTRKTAGPDGISVVVGLISDNNEIAYLEEVRNLENWCQRKNLLLNISKTKELIVDFSTKQERNYYTPIINKSPVETLDSFRYLGVHITQDLSWSCHINTMVKKAQQHLYHLRCLRNFRLLSKVGCELEEKERFWSELDEVMESIPTGERVVIGADFNGHVGEGNTGDEEVMGKFGVKEKNLEGQMVVDFAKRMDMGVVNTYFQKREEHRVTYKSGAEVIRETGRKVLGVSSGKRKEDKETWWWNEEVQDSIQRKRLAKKKWDMDRTEENRQEYKELQCRVKREVSKAKQKAYDELYTRLDTRDEQKDLYRLARQRDRDGKDVQQVRVIKDRDGRVLTSEESVQRRWKEYFEELMNEENERGKKSRRGELCGTESR